MGLDQFAYTPEHYDDPEFVWRKHAHLQEFMEQLFVKRTGKDDVELNNGELELTQEDIWQLEQLVKSGTLPESPGGFFYGHQHQDETAQEYHAQDLAFCKWALAVLETRKKVIYSCWW